MDEPGRTHAATAWWRGLSGAWRANVGLYCLATLALVALVTQIVTGGGRPPQRVEVASRAPTTPPTSPRSQIPTTAPPTTAVGPATTQAPAPTPAPGPAAPNTPPPPAPLSVKPFVPDDPTTIPPPACRNSSSSDCGPFFWDPAPAPNQQLSINVTATTTSSTSGRDVTFSVRVADPDHPVTDSCAQIDFGDGSVDRRPCSFPPCPDAHGAWDPPPVVGGDRTFSFTHRYFGGPYTATFTFHTDDDPPCPNPYGSAGQSILAVPGP